MKNTITLFLGLLAVAVSAGEPPRVAPVPDSVRQEFHLAPFYKKHVSAGGVPVVSSDKPSDFALLEAAWILNRMLAGRDDVRAAIVKNKVRLVVMGFGEFTTDVPEHSDMKPAAYWNRRARGLGASQERPAVSCGEENLLCYPGDPYAPENILVHEFGHVIHDMGMNSIDPTFDRRLRETFEAAKRDGLWKGTYAGSNYHEYWAEGVQSWFDTNDANNAEHNDIDTREKLKRYDPRFAKLLAEVFPGNEWRYTRPAKHAGEAHLAGFDAAKSPRFTWPKEKTPALPKLAALAAPPAQSPPGGKGTSIIFRNNTREEVEVDWIDFEGARIPYGHLRPRMTENLDTYSGHVWVIKSGDGREIATFVAGDTAREAVIEEPKADRKK